MLRRLLTATLLLATGGIVANAEILLPDRQYRFCTQGSSATSNGGCSEVLCKKLQATGNPACNPPNKFNLPEVVAGKSSTGTQWKIAFLEYNDKGKRWDLAQRGVVKAVIEEARQGRTPLTLLMYVHGWQNNAYNSGDVGKFHDYVMRYAEHVKSDSRRRIVGVYLAWRGRSLNISPVVDWLSFWTRGITAGIVGVGDLRQDVDCLAGWGKGPLSADGTLRDCEDRAEDMHPQNRVALSAVEPNPLTPADSTTLNRVVLKGHSFGGRVLDHALLSKSNKGTIQASQCSALETRVPILSKLDLFMLENSATGGVNVRRQLKDCQPCRNDKKGCADYDEAAANYSKAVMARSPEFFGGTNPSRSCGVDVDPKTERCQPYPLVMSISGKRDFLTRILLPIATLGQIPASFMMPLQTHEATPVNPGQKVDVTKGELFQFQAENGSRFVFRRKGKFTPANPIWTLDVDAAIIKDHPDVWNATVMNLEMNLMNFGSELYGRGNKATDPNNPKLILDLPKSALMTK